MKRRIFCFLLLLTLMLFIGGCASKVNNQGVESNSDINKDADVDINLWDDNNREQITGNEIVVEKMFNSFGDMYAFYCTVAAKNELSLCFPFVDFDDYKINYSFSGVCNASAYNEFGYNVPYNYLYFGGEIYSLDEFDNKQQYCLFNTLKNVDSFDLQTCQISFKANASKSNVYYFYINDNIDPFLRLALNDELVDNEKAELLLKSISNSIIKL